tara:strand:- start:20820 stop:21623 length:804 start_codon:yes stop_codon:yes gene_type:complete
MITFVIHYRHDSAARVENLSVVTSHFRAIAPDCKFLIVIDDDKFEVPEFISGYDDIVAVFMENDGDYNKCRGYNVGLSCVDTELVCFLDADCIISKENLDQTIKTSLDTNMICIGYNGTCIYLTESVKSGIASMSKPGDTLYCNMDSLVSHDNIQTDYTNKHYTVGNTKAVGGCLMGKTNLFRAINGFNPNFIGWGYEDNEIISRCGKLGQQVCYINSVKPLLFHFPHEEDPNRDKGAHAYYNSNLEEVTKVEAMNKEELQQYIKTW